jgi:hypothetical protein
MSRRLLLVLPAVLAAITLPVTPALAGEDGDDSTSAALHAPQGCVGGDHTTAAVTGDNIDAVAFFLDGNHVTTVTRPNARGRYSMTLTCAHLRVGAHHARAVVTFAQGSSPARQTLRFQITRSRRGTPRFAG